MEQTPRAQPFFKYPSAAPTSAAVAGDIRLSDFLLVSVLAVLSKSLSA